MRGTLHKLYCEKLWLQSRLWQRPNHVGIILDGNRRFAREAGTAVLAGHHKGADKLDEVLSWCERAGIAAVSVWGFSLDNFKREPGEVAGLMQLFERKFLELVSNERVHRDQIRIHSFGRIALLPDNVREAIARAEAATAHYTRRTLNIGIAYGGREEIVDAFRRYLDDHRDESPAALARKLVPEDIGPYLYTAHVADPDLIIRTSGEVRLSGFLLWQSAHAEFYFCDTYWPAFREEDFLRALRSYDQRQRRFGR